MCFSATASFTAGAVLSVVGVATIKKAKTKRQLPFAVIPLLFGVQQIIEGLVWLSFGAGTPFLAQIATYSFVFFAYILWPVFVPFSILLLERNAYRRKVLIVLQSIGIGVAGYFLYFMTQNPIASRIVCDSVAYTNPHGYGAIFVTGMYVLVTCLSCLVSSHRRINILGVLLVISLGVAYHAYTATYTSVWCFFAGILSICIYWYFKKK